MTLRAHGAPMPGRRLPSIAFDSLDHGRIAFGGRGGWRMLVVYRGRHCPACATYLRRLAAMHPSFAALGIEVIAASADPADIARAQAQQASWPFVVGVALDEAAMRGLGLYVSCEDEPAWPFAEPGTFVIDDDGVLRALDLSNVPFSRPDLRPLLEGLRVMRRDSPPIHGTA